MDAWLLPPLTVALTAAATPASSGALQAPPALAARWWGFGCSASCEPMKTPASKLLFFLLADFLIFDYRRASPNASLPVYCTLTAMTAAMQPEAALSTLPKADGSATYSHAGYTITASANGPLEAQRRDEHPYEALVDVVVRPASGVGGVYTGPRRLNAGKRACSLTASCRHPRETSRVSCAAFLATNHSRQTVSALPHPDCTANHSHACKRLRQHKADSGGCGTLFGRKPWPLINSIYETLLTLTDRICPSSQLYFKPLFWP